MQLPNSELPFSKAEFYAAMQKYADEEQVRLNPATGKPPKPRASSLGRCARQQAADMVGTPTTNPQSPESVVTTEQGRRVEDLSADAIAFLNKGLILRRGMALPDDYPVTGHPDGEFGILADGFKWGWEHKNPGRYGYMDIIKGTFEATQPGYLTQVVLYGDALEWDRVLVQVVSQDASSIRTERSMENRKKDSAAWVNHEDYDPKVQLIGLDLHPLYPFIPALHERAKQIAELGTPDKVAREYDGKVNFPCNYCRIKDYCNELGDVGTRVTSNPLGMD